jgi:DNA polymerase-3 subunit gamma/tau
VIARKWRPQSFDQIVGQNHISQTLANALKNGRLPHALLFTGPRGTGKTSSARILAKSLRCPNAVDFVPCNQCQSCQDISVGRALDVMEIDGASNNGVDAIRELRDTVVFMPSSGKFKVYIIDEVHMLSTSAFNALLKTLEEPPAHVVFIMATTDAHKIPQTVLSRCQRFDFRSIPTRQITDHLQTICRSEGVNADPEALWIIARQGDGSMRDAQSLLDQVTTFANGELTREKIIEILGLTDRALLLETVTGLVQRNTPQILSVIEKIHTAGYEPGLYAQDLLETLRNLMLIKLSTERSTIVELPDSEIRFLKDLSTQVTEEDLHMLFDMALKGANDLPRSQEPRIVLEMVLLRMVAAPTIVQLSDLFQNGIGGTNTSTANTQTARPMATQAAHRTTPPLGVQASSATARPAASPMALNPNDKWFEFVQKIKGTDALFAAKVEGLLFGGVKDKTLELSVPKKMSFLKDQMNDPEIQKKLKSMIDQHWGAGYTFQIVAGREDGASAVDMTAKKAQVRDEEIAQQVADHPLVKSAQAVFKGQIKSIKETPSGVRK